MLRAPRPRPSVRNSNFVRVVTWVVVIGLVLGVIATALTLFQ